LFHPIDFSPKGVVSIVIVPPYRFLPKENGVYYVHIKLNEAHIPHSPLPILVGKIAADPALVFANGLGLESGDSGMYV